MATARSSRALALMAVLFGIVCGLGMLTKWTFVFFLILPAVWSARKNIKNAAIAATVT